VAEQAAQRIGRDAIAVRREVTLFLVVKEHAHARRFDLRPPAPWKVAT
jgi:hypothetical protein